LPRLPKSHSFPMRYGAVRSPPVAHAMYAAFSNAVNVSMSGWTVMRGSVAEQETNRKQGPLWEPGPQARYGVAAQYGEQACSFLVTCNIILLHLILTWSCDQMWCSQIQKNILRKNCCLTHVR
jgi:hypothetical protein